MSETETSTKTQEMLPILLKENSLKKKLDLQVEYNHFFCLNDTIQ